MHCCAFTAEDSARKNCEKPTCPKCAAEHMSTKCMADFKKCINCSRANRSVERGHSVNDHCRPLLMSEMARV